MDLPAHLAWLIDEASASSGPEHFIAELGRQLLAEGLPLAGGALTLAVPHPIIARRTWLWRADTGAVIEALDFAGSPLNKAAGDWLAGLGPVYVGKIGRGLDGPILGWAGSRPFDPAEGDRLHQTARFATAPLATLTARTALTTLLEAYLGRRSAAQVQAGALARSSGETIRAALLCADLRDFTALSEATEPSLMIAILDAWFDRVAGAVHAFGGEVLKFIGDGVLAIFPVTGTPAEACEASLRAVAAVRAGMAHLDVTRQTQGLPPLPFGVALHFGEMLWGNIGAADRLDFTAIGPAVNLVSRLEGLCKSLGHRVLISGALAAETTTRLVPLGQHRLRGIADPCAVFTLPTD
ncbi:class 3 adenylate cyclase [Rhizobium sp. BK650]|uniref:adenylate/guanylate cyclase domain-containing protein n=1 Tax=Rhizobium sp. BK650 TaxID=2586990 RepID=UPI00160B1571|nr:adenylate/guanylate cyclase domain-containing protein [Rhizobium sp. BK650]MBB3659301.1 class 3 adenylate cyclase [Rhizobium sp. BK650]